MGTPFMAEIRIVSFNFPPKGWAFCNGQLLPINQNQALFALLGTTYGGDGRTTFALPDFRGAAPVHTGSTTPLGSKGGEATHTLILSEIPTHTHLLTATSQDATENSISGNTTNPSTPAVSNTSIYSNAAPNAIFAPAAVGSVGGSTPHSNMQPSLVLTFIIALVGIFPSRN
jgi:microcystin-dependent protein